MRCSSCNKFVSFDTELEPESDGDPEVNQTDGVVVITATFRRVLACGECGEELKEASLEVERELAPLDFNGGTPDTCEKRPDGAHVWSVTGCDAEPTERSQTHDRNGKTIKNRRYAKTFYGVKASVTLTCDACETEVVVVVGAEEQASAFDEC